MGPLDGNRYQKLRLKEAQRLASRVFAQTVDSRAPKGVHDAELAQQNDERVQAFVAGRRHREAKLVADFSSDDIYDLRDETTLAIKDALGDSYRRVDSSRKIRKRGACVELILDDLIRELQILLISCDVYVGLVLPGKRSAQIITKAGSEKATFKLSRGAGGKRRPVSRRGHPGNDLLRRSTNSASGASPTSDVVFACIDNEAAVVIGVDPDEGLHRGPEHDDIISPSGILVPREGNREGSRNQPSRPPPCSDANAEGLGRGSPVSIERKAMERNTDKVQRPSTGCDAVATSFYDAGVASPSLRHHEETSELSAACSPSDSRKQSGQTARPQLCLPLAGTGDTGCIGFIGAQGFSIGTVVEDADWREWASSRFALLDREDPREVKRLRLVRPRGLPTKGKLEDVPSGTAAKVVFGRIERIYSNRGIPVYAVRWEDGLRQLDVPRKHMREVVAEEDSSAGKGVPLTTGIVKHLTWIGQAIGPLIDRSRKAAYLDTLRQVTLKADALAQDVLESALHALVQCTPSAAQAEVWQLDQSGRIRCTASLSAEGRFCRFTRRVDDSLHEDEIEAFVACATPKAPTCDKVPQAQIRGDSDCTVAHQEGSRTEASILGADGGSSRSGRVVLVSRRRKMAAAAFRDPCYKVGKSWVGSDRLAEGFAVVLRTAGTDEPTLLSRDSESTPCTEFHPELLAAGVEEAVGATKGAVGYVKGTDFLEDVATEVEIALSCVRGRERRRAVRALALKKLVALCSCETTSGDEANQAALAEISAALPGCCAYVGMLQPGGDSLVYEAATSNSTMLRKVLHRGEGVSFTPLDCPYEDVLVVRYRPPPAASRRAPMPPHPTEREDRTAIVAGSKVEAWYASSWIPATVLRSRGHGFFDIKYMGFDETEAGVPGWRLRESPVVDHLKVKIMGNPHEVGQGQGEALYLSGRGGDRWPWPFVCIPLRCDGNRVGVLGVDGWAGVPLGREGERHPEIGALSFLKTVAGNLAGLHHRERFRKALCGLRETLGSMDATEDGALETLLMLLREAVVFRVRIDVMETRSSSPGSLYRRARWVECGMGTGEVCDVRDVEIAAARDPMVEVRQVPAQVFDTETAPREEELCITPSQDLGLDDQTETLTPALGCDSGADEIARYRREIHQIARDGANVVTGSLARSLESRPGEIVGRFRRLVVGSGGGRPSSDGHYLVRVMRALPEANLTRRAAHHRSQSAASGAKEANGDWKVASEEGDVILLSDMCRLLEEGFMAIASRAQRACNRAKALEVIAACCRSRPSVTSAGSLTPGASLRFFRGHCGPPFRQQTRGAPTGLHETIPRVTPVASFLGRSAPTSVGVAATSAIKPDKTTFPFTAPMGMPFEAETPDSRKGTLVFLKDGRLGILVQHGERKEVVLELPGGKQEVLAASEVSGSSRVLRLGVARVPSLRTRTAMQQVVPGQSVLLQSGEVGILAETAQHGIAFVVVGSDAEAALVQETKRGELITLPWSTLRDPEQIAAIATGWPWQAVSKGVGDITKKVVNAIQWALPQADVYGALLAPYGSALHFFMASSRSVAEGKRLYRNSEPKARDALGVVPGAYDKVQTPSWDVIDTCTSVIIHGPAAADSKRLCFFSEPSRQGWPWVAVPLRVGARSRALRGILCVDSFENSQATSSSAVQYASDGIRKFLEVSAAQLGLALDREAKSQALERLRRSVVEDGAHCSNTRTEKIGDIESPGAFEGAWDTKGEDISIISSAKDVYAAVTTALAGALVHCERFEVRKTRVDAAQTKLSLTYPRPWPSEVPDDGPREQTQSVCAMVWNTCQPSDGEGRFFLEPSFAGKRPPLPLVGNETQMLRLDIRHCSGLVRAADRFGLCRPFCEVHWKGRQLGTTPKAHHTIRPVWKRCHFDLPLGRELPGVAGEDESIVTDEEGGVDAGSGFVEGADRRGDDGEVKIVGGSSAEMRAGTGGPRTAMASEGGLCTSHDPMELLIEVWDDLDGAAPNFQGELRVESRNLLEMARNARWMRENLWR